MGGMIDNTLAAQVPQFNLANTLQQGAQAQAAQDAVQQEQTKAKQQAVGAEMRGVAPFVNTPDFPAKWADAASKLLQNGTIDQATHDRIANSPSPLMLKSIIASTDSPEMALKKTEDDQAQKNTVFSQGIQTQQMGLAANADKRAQTAADNANMTPLEQAQQRAQAADSYGLKQGTPDYQAFVLNGKLPTASNAAPPDNLVEYNAATQQGYKGSLVDFIKEKKAPLVNIDQKVEGAQSSEVGKALGKTQAADIDAGSHASQTLRQLATLDNANKAGGDDVSSGPFGELVLKGKQGLNEIAGEDLANAAPSEVIKKVGFGLATNLTKAITNRPAQMEFMKALENVPNLMMSKTGREAMTSIMTQEKRAEQDIGKIASRHRDAPNGPVWQEVKDKYYDEHPLISPFTGKPFSPADIEMVVKSVPGSKSASAPAGGVTRADIEAEIARRAAAGASGQ